MKTGRIRFTLGVVAAGLLAFGFLGCSSDSGGSSTGNTTHGSGGSTSGGGTGGTTTNNSNSSSNGTGGSGTPSSNSSGSGGASTGSGGDTSPSSSSGSGGSTTPTSGAGNCDPSPNGACTNCTDRAVSTNVWTPSTNPDEQQTQSATGAAASGGFFSYPNSGWSGDGTGGDGKCDGTTNCVPLADDTGDNTKAMMNADDGFICPWGAKSSADAGTYGGGFGLSFQTGSPTPGFDLSAYTGVTFQIYVNTSKFADATTKLKFQVGLTDTETGCGVCDATSSGKCSDDPSKNFNLTGTKDSPQTVDINFADLTAGGWGSPKTPALNAAELGHVATFKWAAQTDADWAFCIGAVTLKQ